MRSLTSGGRPRQVGSVDVLFGAQVGVDAVGVVDRGEGFGLGSGQRGGDLLGRGALRFADQPSAVVAVVEGLAGGVPGVGGSDGAGLAHIAAVAVQGRGGQQVDLVPGAALDPVDGASPGVRHQGRPSSARPVTTSAGTWATRPVRSSTASPAGVTWRTVRTVPLVSRRPSSRSTWACSRMRSPA